MRVGEKNMFKFSESFKNVEKDIGYIVSKIYEDTQTLKLLSLRENDTEVLTEKEKKAILDRCVKIVPKVTPEDVGDEGYSIISMQFTTFTKNASNPAHRDKFLVFNIISHYDNVNMGDFKLRPYQIAGRLDALFDKKSLAGTYSIEFLSADTITLDDDIFGMSLIYTVTYSEKSDRNDDEE